MIFPSSKNYKQFYSSHFAYFILPFSPACYLRLCLFFILSLLLNASPLPPMIKAGIIFALVQAALATMLPVSNLFLCPITGIILTSNSLISTA